MKSKNVKNINLVLSYAIPTKNIWKFLINEKYPQIQTINFNNNFIKSLSLSKDYKNYFLSSRPIREYPFSKLFFINGKIWKLKKNLEIKEISLLNLFIIKDILRIVTFVLSGIKLMFFKNNRKYIVVFSLNFSYLLSSIILASFFRMRICAVWTDPPSVSLKDDNKIKHLLRKIELKLIKYLMRKVHKVIVLSKFLALDFAPRTPYLVMEGFSSPIVYKEKLFIPKKFVYTGSLSQDYGLLNLLYGFIEAKLTDFTLEIYGSGNLVDLIEKLHHTNKNILYKGFVSTKTIKKVQSEAGFLINTRFTNDYYSRYSFPSKTLEYLSTGTPVISTLIPGISEEYKDHIILLNSNNVKEIARVMKYVSNISLKDYNNIAISGYNFSKQKTLKKQSIRIYNFLNYDNNKTN